MKDDENPYAPPAAHHDHWEHDESHGSLVDASSSTRFANAMIDGVGVLIFTFVVAYSMFAMGWRIDDIGDGFGILTTMFYYAFFEGFFGRTPAKFMTGTRVVREDGGRPRFTQILGRTVVRMLPFDAFSFLGRTNGWHDRWSGTRVVRVGLGSRVADDDDDFPRKRTRTKRRRTVKKQSIDS